MPAKNLLQRFYDLYDLEMFLSNSKEHLNPIYLVLLAHSDVN